MSKEREGRQLTRRTFVKGSALATVAAAAAGGSLASLYGCTDPAGDATGGRAADVVWSACNVNCGGNCLYQWHVTEGMIDYMESDNTGDTNLQARACLRGRSMRRWINNPDRLQYPMKRIGPRGSGEFERISWDEAISTIAEKLQYTIDTYGNKAIHKIYATGMYSATGNPSARLLNCVGGFLNGMYDYSTHMLQVVMPFMYGDTFSPYDNFHASSFSEAGRASDLVVMFGNSPAETRMGGANAVWDYIRMREAIYDRGGRVINIDFRMNESISGHPEEWVPIRPGTDAALVNAIAHEWIVEGKVDEEFLRDYTVGYDEESLPDSAKGQNKSYHDYIMGTGYDMVEKTPEWAEPITQIPADTIRALAAEIAAAKAPYICQGWGPQRHTNGEESTRAICMLPILIGQIGLPGTNTGQREAEPPAYLVGGIPAGDNAVEVAIPCYQWLNAVEDGKSMTALNAGVKGADRLDTDIKFIWNYAGNTVTNQHGDINYTHDILVDESKCEFILCWDTVLTSSAKYADILLPDAMRSEQMNLITQGYSEYYTGVLLGQSAQAPPFENRSSYDVMADIADAMGVKEEFTEGKTHDEWVKEIYEAGAEASPELPKWDDMLKQGIFKKEVEPSIGLKDFRDDPKANALGTPSGKIEIYSETLDELNDTWELPEGQVISAIPVFNAGLFGYGTVTDAFPLYACGFHHKARTHSSFAVVSELRQAARNQIWINSQDADPRGIATGDQVIVASPNGKIQVEARVTPRVIPGSIAIPQGAWHDADMTGDRLDKGGCVNTLTAYEPTPLAKGNGSAHSMIVQVSKA
ncbi:MAG: molybdopterin-dependent oxidoreductase [Coriobacteriia bacterium]|nr:molybdopterin-dependent oxidoreductase [Coriobacteriia bacterium]MCL2750987.1 molybdopterin-dependent oxidoreductase [Coriobacteriia bacterium]